VRAGPMKTWGPLCTQGIWGGNEEEEHARGDLGGVQEVEVTHLSGRRVKVDPLRARRREATAPGSGRIWTGGNQAFEAEISTSTRTTVGGFRSGGLAGSAGAATEWLRAPRRAGQPTTINDYIHFEDAHGGEHARRARQEYERIEAIHFSVPEGRGANARVPGERETDACERAVHPRRADAVAGGQGGAANAPRGRMAWDLLLTCLSFGRRRRGATTRGDQDDVDAGNGVICAESPGADRLACAYMCVQLTLSRTRCARTCRRMSTTR